MRVLERAIQEYVSTTGKNPFRGWYNRLKDMRAKVIIEARLTRVSHGNLGQCRSIGQDVMELKIDFGPGYRVYFAQDGDKIIVLLLGGDKSTQSKDIKLAKSYWQEYKERE